MGRSGAPEAALGGAAQRRFYAADLASAGEVVELDEAACRHARVLRLSPGARVELFDGAGWRARGALRPQGRSFSVRLEGPARHEARPHRVHLVQCLPKGGKLDDILRAATELGAASVQPAISEHSVARPGGGRGAGRLERAARVAIEAARQSEQAWVPEVPPPAPLHEVLRRAPTGARRLVLMERSARPFAALGGDREVWLVVGPEGGFSARDRAALAAEAFAPVGLGRAILRVETAAVVGLGLVLDRLGAWQLGAGGDSPPAWDGADR